MTPDLERAARAAEDATDPVKHDHWTFVEVARAVLLALREPSEAMLKCDGAIVVGADERGNQDAGELATIVWQSMIDAILAEKL